MSESFSTNVEYWACGICEQSAPIEAIAPVADHSELRIWRVSLEQIEATVAEFLGPGRVKGNRPAPAFSRHVSMYLARHVSGWGYSKISRFYNSRRQTTVIAAIRKIEKLRQKDGGIDSLIEVLTAALQGHISPAEQNAAESRSAESIAEAVADRVIRLVDRGKTLEAN